MLIGGCGSGRTTVLHQLRDRVGRGGAQYIDVERTATTPEHFLARDLLHSPFPAPDVPADGHVARAAFDAALALPYQRGRAPASPSRSYWTNCSNCARSRAFPGLRRVLHDLVDGLRPAATASS